MLLIAAVGLGDCLFDKDLREDMRRNVRGAIEFVLKEFGNDPEDAHAHEDKPDYRKRRKHLDELRLRGKRQFKADQGQEYAENSQASPCALS